MNTLRYLGMLEALETLTCLFPKIGGGVLFEGVLTVRAPLFWGLYWVSDFSRISNMEVEKSHLFRLLSSSRACHLSGSGGDSFEEKFRNVATGPSYA